MRTDVGGVLPSNSARQGEEVRGRPNADRFALSGGFPAILQTFHSRLQVTARYRAQAADAARAVHDEQIKAFSKWGPRGEAGRSGAGSPGGEGQCHCHHTHTHTHTTHSPSTSHGTGHGIFARDAITAFQLPKNVCNVMIASTFIISWSKELSGVGRRLQTSVSWMRTSLTFSHFPPPI